MPDIGDLARRGGMPSHITPFELSLHNDQEFVSASGNGTPTVIRYAEIGCMKTAADGLDFVDRFGSGVTAEVLGDRIRNLGFMPPDWIRRNFVEKRGDPKQLGKEMMQHIQKRVPALKEWTKSSKLSGFDQFVGPRWCEATKRNGGRVPYNDLVRMAEEVQSAGFPLLENLEKKKWRKRLADHNSKGGRKDLAIKDWMAATKHPTFRRGVRRRFSRAASNFLSANPRRTDS